MFKSCWLLLTLPLLARSDQLDQWLREVGTPPGGDYKRDLLTGTRKFLDQAATRTPLRNIFSETARLAFFETLATAFNQSNLVLFGAEPEQVRKSLSRYASPEGFQTLAETFFRAYLKRSLANVLEKEIPNHHGIAERFAGANDTRELEESLNAYCAETTALLSQYARDWYAKNAIHRQPTEGRTRAFAAYAVEKLVEDLVREQAQ
ncbi:MAG TPA: hypothetical protein VJ085_02525 [Candidatus Acidoferrales bacterium]|nr:hypothetical protein [Candidatus Acidoferrales bacterium]